MASRFLAPVRRGEVARRSVVLDPLLGLQRDMDRLFGSIVRSFGGDEGGAELALVPRIDIRETESGLEIDVELPGVAEQDIEVSVEDDVLLIAGEARREKVEDRGGYRVAERQVGRFRRAIPLPFEPDPDKIDAQMKSGVLKITIAQPPATDRTKRIAVKNGENQPAADSSGANEQQSEQQEQRAATPEHA